MTSQVLVSTYLGSRHASLEQLQRCTYAVRNPVAVSLLVTGQIGKSFYDPTGFWGCGSYCSWHSKTYLWDKW